MNRNLDWRVEAITPVESPPLRERLREILDAMCASKTHSWKLGADGTCALRCLPDAIEKCEDVQAVLMRRTLKKIRA